MTRIEVSPGITRILLDPGSREPFTPVSFRDENREYLCQTECGFASRPVRRFSGTDGGGWYGLFSAQYFRGGTTAVMETPLSSFPVLVRAGSILPLSSGACSTADLKTPANELVIFSGTDASFVIYVDEGDGIGYQDGAYLSIPLRWEEEKSSLFFGNAEGTMPAGAVFQVRLIRPDGQTKTAGIRYTGTEAVLRF